MLLSKIEQVAEGLSNVWPVISKRNVQIGYFLRWKLAGRLSWVAITVEIYISAEDGIHVPTL